MSRTIASFAAQSAYAFLDDIAAPIPAVTAQGQADLAVPAARRLFGADAILEPFDGGLIIESHHANDASGFSATLLRSNQLRRPILAIRGTDDLRDQAQDLKLIFLGFANDQAISLYRHYRRLTTLSGQPVQYTDGERRLLLRLNIPTNPFPGVGAFLADTELDAALSQDRGLGVLQPGERITVTGHSLGGHLALLLDRLFPGIAEHVYTFNAPGISFLGDTLLRAAGLAGNDPTHITNVRAAYGLDLTAAYGRRPGFTQNVFNELGGPIHNHSIVSLSDSLALHELFGKLSPALANRIDEVSSILAAASMRPEHSLETALDMLRRAIKGDTAATQIASLAEHQAQRNDYYTRLYDLRDTAEARDWGISSLVGATPTALQTRARTSLSMRHALAELLPFEVAGAPGDDSLRFVSHAWLEARSEFLVRLLEGRKLDQAFVEGRGNRNVAYLDVDKQERLFVLGAAYERARSLSGAPAELDSYLAAQRYDAKTIFGSSDAAISEVLEGAAGADRLFGNAGGDTLRGEAGADVLDGGAGADVMDAGEGDDTLIGGDGSDHLLGGSGRDLYLADAVDRIRDSDGIGEIRLHAVTSTLEGAPPPPPDGGPAGPPAPGGPPPPPPAPAVNAPDILTGGHRQPDGSFRSADGRHVYSFADLSARGTLVVDGTLTIESFANGELGIFLTDAPDGSGGGAIYFGDRDPSSADQYGNPTGAVDANGRADVLYGSPGDTTLYSLARSDVVFEAFDGDDWIEGGSGSDLLVGSGGNDVIYADSRDQQPDGAVAPGAALESHALSGGSGGDTLFGSAQSDYIEGGAEDDLIVAGNGNDAIFGDGETLSAWIAQNTGYLMQVNAPAGVWRFALTSTLLGTSDLLGLPNGRTAPSSEATTGAGDDTIHAGPGIDYVRAGGGSDAVYGGPGNDEIDGGNGDDVLLGEDGSDDIRGDAGDDELFGGASGDHLDGGDGADYLHGGEGADMLTGGAGADWLEGGDGDDLYFVGAGDTVVIGPGLDRIAGEEDTTAVFTVRFADTASETVYLVDEGVSWTLRWGSAFSTLSFDGAFDTWQGVRAVFADGTTLDHSELAARRSDGFEVGFGEYRLFGTALADVIVGRPGADDHDGGAGDDTYLLHAGDGRDTVQDSSGTDALVFQDVTESTVSVHSSGDDLIVRYTGGEVRLLNQALPSSGIESVRFADATAWSRAELAARASALPAAPQLDVQVLAPGEVLSVDVGAQLAAGERMLGTASFEGFTAQGEGLPAWLNVDPATGRLSGTPAGTDSGVTSVLVALRDGQDVVGMAPVVVVVDSAPTAPSEPAAPEESAPVATVAVLVTTETPSAEEEVISETLVAKLPTPTIATNEASEDEAEVTPAVVLASEMRQDETREVGRIEDAVYERIGDLLFAPPTTHASGFLERYAEAVREFRERQTETERTPSPPPPTDEEMAAYNEAMHAWLDGEEQRLAASSADDGWDYGATGMRYFGAGSGVDRLVTIGEEALARPGLAALRPIQPQPALSEGMRSISG